MSSLNPVAQRLRTYKQSLGEFEPQWDDFSAVDKCLCPIYHCKTHLRGLINSDTIRHGIASSRMQAVVGFYRFLAENERLGFRPQNAPWVDRTVGLEYRDSKGLKQIKEVMAADVSIRVPKWDYARDRRIDGGGKLLSLSRYKQKTLVKALKLLDSHDYKPMHYIALLTGAWIQTILILYWGGLTTPPS